MTWYSLGRADVTLRHAKGKIAENTVYACALLSAHGDTHGTKGKKGMISRMSDQANDNDGMNGARPMQCSVQTAMIMTIMSSIKSVESGILSTTRMHTSCYVAKPPQCIMAKSSRNPYICFNLMHTLCSFRVFCSLILIIG